jgi:hypothetical protein
MSNCYAWQCAYLFKFNCFTYLGHSPHHAE